jgi:hypothetical protein
MVAVEIPIVMTYLETFQQGGKASIEIGTNIYVKLQKRLNAFLRGVQFSGSSGFFEGAGTRIMSWWPLECIACEVPSTSTK